jgi:hypothetical protein
MTGVPSQAAPPLPAAVRVHGLAEARAALAAAAAAGRPVALVSAPSAAAHAGAGWFLAVVARARAEFPGVDVTAVLDCGERAGDAQGAIAAGVTHIAFTGPLDTIRRLSDVADAAGARIVDLPVTTLNLPDAHGAHGARNAVAACHSWIMAN